MGKARALFAEEFSFDGRGPELECMYWRNGRSLVAIEYTNGSGDEQGGGQYYVSFAKTQVVMITPEEVIGSAQLPENFLELGPAGLMDLGKSEWLLSFNQRHLGACSHFKLLFYDELIDVICEGLDVQEGGYPFWGG